MIHGGFWTLKNVIPSKSLQHPLLYSFYWLTMGLSHLQHEYSCRWSFTQMTSPNNIGKKEGAFNCSPTSFESLIGTNGYFPTSLFQISWRKTARMTIVQFTRKLFAPEFSTSYWFDKIWASMLILKLIFIL